MSMSTLAERCTRTGAQAARLAADPAETLRAASILLRGAPQLAAWVAGWASTEFPLHVVAGHALTAVDLAPLHNLTSALSSQKAGSVLSAAMTETFGADYAEQVHHPIADAPVRRHSVAGFWHATQHSRRYSAMSTNISYGPSRRDHLLDIWRMPGVTPEHRAPVLLQVPGGAWAISEKRGQAVPLLGRMAALGWICVRINYSRIPGSAWPAHIIDVKRAIAWIRENIAEYGGDPDFIAITGGSAGAHIGALAALTANDPALQPGFEDADTSVAAAVPYYGAYDLTDAARMHPLMMPFLERFVMRARVAEAAELFAAASPLSHVHRDAPPFFVLHGRDDAVIPRIQAQVFTDALRAAGADTVAYAELPNAHHAFDTLATVRSQLAADAVADFLGIAYARHQLAQSAALRRVSTAG